MKDKSCPICRSQGGLNNRYSILITLEDWDVLFLVTLAFAILGHALKLSTSEIIPFAILGLIPVYAKFRKKCVCDKCHIEFVRKGNL